MELQEQAKKQRKNKMRCANNYGKPFWPWLKVPIM